MEKKETKFHHGLITLSATVAFIFFGIVFLDASPQVPLFFGCATAALIARWNRYSWENILSAMIKGISDSLEAILILMLIGMLVGTWIAAGTVPTLICYGLSLLSSKFFLSSAALLCALVSFVLGAWGTVGTIGLALMGIGTAMELSPPLIAGAIISGAYLGEIISPISDATNLTCAVAKCNPFSLMRATMKVALPTFVIVEIVYLVLGFWHASDGASFAENTTPFLQTLENSFYIGVWALLPLVVLVVCIAFKMPALPAMFVGVLAGFATNLLLQHRALKEVLAYSISGFISHTGNEEVDNLLSNGGLDSMFQAITIIIIAMAFGGIMQRTGQMDALMRPLLRFFCSNRKLTILTVLSCICMNVILPDQYLGIAVPCQMYVDVYDKAGIKREDLAKVLLCGGAVTSPLIPWNTCGIYCMGILGIGAVDYAPMTLLGILLPISVVIAQKGNSCK